MFFIGQELVGEKSQSAARSFVGSALPLVATFFSAPRPARGVDTAPEIFWELPPYYWPRSLPAGGRLYPTPDFPVEAGGTGGSHYFMLLDPIRHRAVVWAKHNFG